MNMLGNTAMIIVLGIWVKNLTGSSADAGMIFLLLGATSFLAPVTGLLVDRVASPADAHRQRRRLAQPEQAIS